MTAPSLSDHPVDHYEDPYPYYRLLRESEPVHYDALRGTWLIAKYDDVNELLRDDVRLSAEQGGPSPSMLGSDPPRHTRLRNLVNKAFTPRAVRRLRPRIEDIVNGLLDEAAPRGEMDVIADFAYPLPITVIAELIGVDEVDRGFFREASTSLALSMGYRTDSDATSRAARGSQQIREYFDGLITRRRADPRDDLATACIQAEDAGDQLSHAELMAMLNILLIGGHETTVNLIGNGLLALLNNPEQLERVRDEPIERSAVEELLRYDPPAQYTGRVARHDFQLREKTIRAGQPVRMLLASANRDDDEFPNPDRLDVTREPNHHLSFGFGVHYCLGAELARLEGEIAIPGLLRRFPDLALAGPPPRWRRAPVLRGLESFPVTF